MASPELQLVSLSPTRRNTNSASAGEEPVEMMDRKIRRVVPSRISDLHCPWRSRAYVESPSLSGTYVRFDPKARPSSKFITWGNRSRAFASSGDAKVDCRGPVVVIADSREEGVEPKTLALATQLFHSCLALPKGARREEVAATIDFACAAANRTFISRAPGQPVVLLGSVQDQGKHYIFNQSGGMVFLVKKDGGVTCMTDHVLPDHPKFCVSDGLLNPGAVIRHDIPIRCQPFVVINEQRCHAARGLGYPEQIATTPHITLLGPHKSGDCLLYVTQEGAQNIQRNEVEAALQGCKMASPAQIAYSMAAWLERRSETENPRLAVLVEELVEERVAFNN